MLLLLSTNNLSVSASGSGTLYVSSKGCHFFLFNDYGFGTGTKKSWIVLQVEHFLKINPWSACTQNNCITFNSFNRVTCIFTKCPKWFWCTQCLKTFGRHVGWQIVPVFLGLRGFPGCRTLSAKAGTALGKLRWLVTLDTCEYIVFERCSWWVLASWVSSFLFAVFVFLLGGGSRDHGRDNEGGVRYQSPAYWFSAPAPYFSALLAILEHFSLAIWLGVKLHQWRMLEGH